MEHLTTTVFDPEKTYNLAWKYYIMRHLYNLWQRGKLSDFLNIFLFDRDFKGHVGYVLSQPRQRDPKRKHPLSNLLKIKNNSIIKCLIPGIDSAKYVSDPLI